MCEINEACKLTCTVALIYERPKLQIEIKTKDGEQEAGRQVFCQWKGSQEMEAGEREEMERVSSFTEKVIEMCHVLYHLHIMDTDTVYKEIQINLKMEEKQDWDQSRDTKYCYWDSLVMFSSIVTPKSVLLNLHRMARLTLAPVFPPAVE